MGSKPSIVVTGSSGMIGTALVETLLERGFDVRGIDRRPNPWSEEANAVTTQIDLLDTECGGTFPTGDLIVHLAAHSRVRPTIERPELALENVESTMTVINQAKQSNAGIIFASSREVYGDVRDGSAAEDDFDVRDAENPYAASKVSGEALVAASESCYDVDACVARITNVYGPYDSSDRVIPLFIARALAGKDLVIYGRGKVLDFLYLNDCVMGFLTIIDSFEELRGETINLVSGAGTPLPELASAVSKLVEPEITIRTEDDRRGEVARFVGDPSKAKRVLGFEPRYSLRDGLEETIEWYRTHESVLRGVTGSET